jgi:hypothetical protein
LTDFGIEDERPFRDVLLLVGMPAAEKRDQIVVIALVGPRSLGAAAVLEGVQRATPPPARAPGLDAIAIATVALAFAAIGVMMWKTSG